MPESKGRRYLRLEMLLAAVDPTYKLQPITTRDLEIERKSHEEIENVRRLMEIRRGYTGKWNAGAKYLFEELIRAYGVDDEWRRLLIELAKPTPGRRHSAKKAIRIALLKRQGMTAAKIAEQLGHDGDGISTEAVESYSKRRRKRSVEEEAHDAVQRAFSKRKRSE